MKQFQLGNTHQYDVEELGNGHPEILASVIAMKATLESNASEAVKQRTIQIIMDDIISFLQNHLAEKEGLTESTRSRDSVSHKKELEYLLGRLQCLQKMVRAGDKMSGVEALSLLGNLWYHHNLRARMQLVPHLAGNSCMRWQSLVNEQEKAEEQPRRVQTYLDATVTREADVQLFAGAWS